VVEVSIIISILSLIVAGSALYFSQLKKAKITPIVGPQISVYHHDYESGMSTGFIIPTSFLNDAPSTGNIIRTSFSIQKSDKSEEAYYMQWQKFEIYNDEKYKWDHESDAHPLVITPRSGIHKNIWVMWHAFHKRKLILEKGQYTITTYLWSNESSKPTKFSKNFLVTEEHLTLLKSNRDNKEFGSVLFQIDKELEINKLLTESELEKLL
jgi:hypothetical protein